MVQFSRLRLNGFKSFVERTELEIGPGLTGIVGPNGCGKSNLVEALRWTMGESSARRMRGDGMEDVIFAGTARRPARNFAEVSIVLDNSARLAPPHYNSLDEIEIVRRIERDHGSAFRINGRAARSRDVQMLFADALTGPNSPALVSQGRVTAIINAKPLERRMILEESAGIAGLYARRHEAELRLKAADENLLRLQDVVTNMETQLASLRRQGRQAARYRALNAEIRDLETRLALIEWTQILGARKTAETTFRAADQDVASRMLAVTQLTRTEATQGEDIPALRQAEAEAAAAFQAQRLTLQRLEDEETRTRQQLEEARAQSKQIAQDLTHEQQSLEEISRAQDRLAEEERGLSETASQDDGQLETLTAARTEAASRLSGAESAYHALAESVAEIKARRTALEQQVASEQRRLTAAEERISSLTSQLAARRATLEQDDPTARLAAEIETTDAQAAAFKARVEQLRQDLEAARDAIEQERTRQNGARQELSRIDSEMQGLRAVVESGAQRGGFRPVLKDITSDDGFETALARAMGETLYASLDPAAPMAWSENAPGHEPPALPDGLIPLTPHIHAPASLRTALAFIGVAKDDATAEAAAGHLKPGQMIVSRSGALWRWDGLRVKASAEERNAVVLRQKNRLAVLERERPAAAAALETAEAAFRGAQAAADTLKSTLSESEKLRGDADTKLVRLRREHQQALEQRSRAQAELAKLEEGLSLSSEDAAQQRDSLARSRAALEALDGDATSRGGEEELSARRDALSSAREALKDSELALERAKQDQGRRKARLHAIADEKLNLQNRAIRAREHIKALEERARQAEGRLKEATSKPSDLGAQKDKLLATISELEGKRNAAEDRLARAETELAETRKSLKQAEEALSSAREARAHAQATFGAAEERLQALARTVEDQFGLSPQALLVQSGYQDSELNPSADSDFSLPNLRARKEKLVREREGLGAVNLRAEEEMVSVEQELATLLHERNDLTQAIEELRAGIQKLNKEARERLLATFEHVNAHFQRLFTRLFGGGQAHLALIDSDDPLASGLEIFAQPPGKALTSLSLLSGGEQTLTSAALIFAMFLTNPSPICVMDEIDAPLDDANVDRLCDLLRFIADMGKTRFLIITHHRLTMARMDRLYGVTMQEKGISQLVSVDFGHQFDLLDAAE